MHTKTWYSFAVSQTLSKTVLHFVPQGDVATAPYPVACKVTCFRGHEFERGIVLDGLRLGHPDGIRVEDLFPELKEYPSGLFGVKVEFSLSQPRISLEPSRFYVELVTQSGSVKFSPRSIEEDSECEDAFALRDPYHSPSLIIMNLENQAVQLSGEWVSENLDLPEQTILSPLSVYEFPMKKEAISNFDSQECSWGVCKSKLVTIPDEFKESVRAFLMHRDTVSHLPLSVRTL